LDPDSDGDNIDCGLCPSQTKCAGSSCTAFSAPCTCAAATSSCVWDKGSSRCTTRSSMRPSTLCSDCPSQPVCNLKKPTTTAFSPQKNSRGSGTNNVVQVVFDVEIRWCNPLLKHEVSFWCEGSQTQRLGIFYISIVASALNVDTSEAVKGLARSLDRKCGLTVPGELVCDRITGAPFPGISKGAYSFTMRDTSAPTVVSISPMDGAKEVSPNGVVTFTFNEPVKLGPSTLYLTMSTLDTDRSGDAGSEVASKAYALAIPHVTAQGTSSLAFDLKGKTQAGWLYSIGLPPGAVVDLSGNQFNGLAGGKYTFRVSDTGLRSGTGGAGNDMTVFLVALILGLVCGGICISALVWKCQGICYSTDRYKRPDKRVGPVPVPIKHSPSLKQVEPVDVEYHGPSAAPATNSFYGAPTYAAPAQTSQTATSPAPANDRTSWARSGSPAPKAEAKPATFAAEPRRSSSHSRPAPPQPAERSAYEKRSSSTDSRSSSQGPSSKPASKPEPKPEPASKTATSPVVESTNPEARVVEKQMRSMMNEPLAVRKKMIKDLMFEHHPDKNAGSDSAKEVFQFINGARGWFLHDA